MTKIRRFEDLIGWQKARQVANFIHALSFQPKFAQDYRLRNQILDAAGSVMHNIAEGCDAGTDLEFIRFLKIDRRSASEVQSELYLALDRRYITENDLKKAYELTSESKRLINGLIAYLRKNQKGTNHKVQEEIAEYSTNITMSLPDEFYQVNGD